MYGKSNQGAKEVILDFGRFINEANNTSKIRIWLEVAKDGTYNVRSIQPKS